VSPLCHCLIAHPVERRFLLLPDGLPRVEHDTGWFPYAAETLRWALRERLGVETTALRHLLGGPIQVGVMELQEPAGAPPDGARWAGAEALAGLDPVVRPHAAAWLAERPDEVPAERAPWERPGWYAGATAWIGDRLARLGRPATGPVEQVKAAWSWSCILRVPTAAGRLYFKACYPKGTTETGVVLALRERWPGSMPRLVAADAARDWMLMEEFADDALEGTGAERVLSPEQWAAALAQFARIQIATADEVDRWLAMGCADLRPTRVAEQLAALVAETTPRREGEPAWRLSGDQIAALRALLPELLDGWRRLDDLGVPPGIVQMDFRLGNFARQGDGFLYFDWGDTVVAHPFLAPIRCLDYVDDGDAVSRAAIREGYLAPWRERLPGARLDEAFDLVRRLNPSFQALRWRREWAYVELASPWGSVMRQAVDECLGWLLKEAAA
jgi:hypothetical protein